MKNNAAMEDHWSNNPRFKTEQEPVPVKDNTYGYAKSLAEAIFKLHFSSDEHYASGRIVWGVNDTVIGILTQIDNMVADMVRRSAQPEQVAVCVGYWNQKTGSYYKPDQISASHQKLIEDGILRRCYTTPPQRTWVGLTEEEVIDLWPDLIMHRHTYQFWKNLEAKLKEKNP